MMEAETWSFVNPKYVGKFVFGANSFQSIHYYMTTKPRWLTRKMLKIFFEIDWIDEIT